MVLIQSNGGLLLNHHKYYQSDLINQILVLTGQVDLLSVVSTSFGSNISTDSNVQNLISNIISAAATNDNSYIPKMIIVPKSQLFGHLGGYHAQNGEILLSHSIVLSALSNTRDGIKLAGMLLEEFGHHLEQLCLSATSSTACDLHGDEGAKFGKELLKVLNTKLDSGSLLETTSIDVFSIVDDGLLELKKISIELRELCRMRFRLYPQSEILHDHKHGGIEFFGAGKPHSNSCTHYTIEKDAYKDSNETLNLLSSKFGYNSLIQKKWDIGFVEMVYKGNWARDLSQAIDVKPLQLTGLTRDTLTKIVALTGHSEFIGDLMNKESRGKSDFLQAKNYADYLRNTELSGNWEDFVSKDALGVYLSWEHLDNPKQYSSTNTSIYDKDLKDLSQDPNSDNHYLKYEHMIDDVARMKSYIHMPPSLMRAEINAAHSKDIAWFEEKNRGGNQNKPNWMSSKQYVDQKLQSAYSNLTHPENSLFDLGSALHVMEDFFAHSNYIEILLIRIGERLSECDIQPDGSSGCTLQGVRMLYGGSGYVDANNQSTKNNQGSNTSLEVDVNVSNGEVKNARITQTDQNLSLGDIIYIDGGDGTAHGILEHCFCKQFKNTDGNWLTTNLPTKLKKIDPWVPSPHRCNVTSCSSNPCQDAGHKTAATWTTLQGSVRNPSDYIPLVTGTFTEFDILASLSDKMVDLFEPGGRDEKISKESRLNIIESGKLWEYTSKHRAIEILLKDKNLPHIILDEMIEFLFDLLDDNQMTVVEAVLQTNLDQNFSFGSEWHQLGCESRSLLNSCQKPKSCGECNKTKFAILSETFNLLFNNFNPVTDDSDFVLRSQLILPFIKMIKSEEIVNTVDRITSIKVKKRDVYNLYCGLGLSLSNQHTYSEGYDTAVKNINKKIIDVKKMFDIYTNSRKEFTKFKTTEFYEILTKIAEAILEDALPYVPFVSDELRNFFWIGESISNFVFLCEHAFAQVGGIVNRLLARVIRNDVDTLQSALGAFALKEVTNQGAVFDELNKGVQKALELLDANAATKQFLMDNQPNFTWQDVQDVLKDKLPSSVDWNLASTDPTHSMLAKDCPDHPLHNLAGEMAKAVSSAMYTDFRLTRTIASEFTPIAMNNYGANSLFGLGFASNIHNRINSPIRLIHAEIPQIVLPNLNSDFDVNFYHQESFSFDSKNPYFSEKSRLLDRLFRHPDFLFEPSQHINSSHVNSNLATSPILQTEIDFSKLNVINSIIPHSSLKKGFCGDFPNCRLNNSCFNAHKAIGNINFHILEEFDFNIPGPIEQVMMGQIMDATIRFINATQSNMSQTEYQDVLSPNVGNIENALAILRRPRYGLLPQMKIAYKDIVEDVSTEIANAHNELTDITKVAEILDDYSSYGSMFIHGLSAADTLTQSYNDISKNSDDISSIWRRLRGYFAVNIDGDLAECDLENLNFKEDCLMKLYLDTAKIISNVDYKDILKVVANPTSPYALWITATEFTSFLWDMDEVNDKGVVLWRKYMDVNSNDFITCPNDGSTFFDLFPSCDDNDKSQPMAGIKCRDCGLVVVEQAHLTKTSDSSNKEVDYSGENLDKVDVGWKVRGWKIPIGTVVAGINSSSKKISLSEELVWENEEPELLSFYHKDIVLEDDW
mgnify:CR=1 FL=1